ncbi:MICOS complex subunit MIC26-like [Neoarius graeffei]|uniref:MICOS complex subunit MIC26-like n=1 Tax=Neoarius graeffei TaxID=443677 RepID=UPI00298D3FDE|nr:MICOS complex subunit MIC26-like [Neoarius graeffei]
METLDSKSQNAMQLFEAVVQTEHSSLAACLCMLFFFLDSQLFPSFFQEKTSYALDKAEECYETIESGINTSVQTVRDTYAFLINPLSEFYPSVSAVGFSVILRFYPPKCRCETVLFPIGLMTLSSSMFYPQHAASLAKEVKDQISSLGSQLRVHLEDMWKGKSCGKKVSTENSEDPL